MITWKCCSDTPLTVLLTRICLSSPFHIQDHELKGPCPNVVFLTLLADMTEQEEHNRLTAYALDFIIEDGKQIMDDALAFSQDDNEGGESGGEGRRAGDIQNSQTAVLMLDGASPQVKFLMEPATIQRYGNKDITVLKSPASCSGSVAVNDVNKGHVNLRRLTQSTDERLKPSTPEKDWPNRTRHVVHRLSKNAGTLSDKSKGLIAQVVVDLPRFLDQANRRTNRAAFKDACVILLSIPGLLQRCSSWNEFTEEEQKLLGESTLNLRSVDHCISTVDHFGIHTTWYRLPCEKPGLRPVQIGGRGRASAAGTGAQC